MNPLRLSPLPCLRSDEGSAVSATERDGFVDEAVVLALVAGSPVSRRISPPADLVLAADDMDFAGWYLPSSPAARPSGTVSFPLEAASRRPAEPVLDEPGIGESHRGSHRWWLAGLAGAISTLLISLLLLSLSSRISSENSRTSKISVGPMPAPLRSMQPAKPTTAKAAPELTEASIPGD